MQARYLAAPVHDDEVAARADGAGLPRAGLGEAGDLCCTTTA